MANRQAILHQEHDHMQLKVLDFLSRCPMQPSNLSSIVNCH